MREKKFFEFVVLLVSVFFLAGCGSSKNSPDVSYDEISDWSTLLNSQSYTGYLAVMFKPETEMRLVDSKFVDKANTSLTSDLNGWLADYGAEAKKGMDISEEVMESALIRAGKEGKKLTDWNLFYNIYVSDPANAESLIRKLVDSKMVRWVHPVPTPYVADVGDTGDVGGDTDEGSPTPILDQLYLDSEDLTGGLNIYAAWNQGITGQGVRIADMEHNWNFNHEDLPIDESDIIYDKSDELMSLDKDDLRIINHGTAVVGVIGAADNANNFTGIAYSSDIKLMQLGEFYTVAGATGSLKSLILNYAEYGWTVSQNGKYNLFIRPGDIMLIELQMPGVDTIGNTCITDFVNHETSNCVPVEGYQFYFEAFENITELGVIVVEGAGNGGIDLGTNKATPNDCALDNIECPDLSVDDSGAIMVAASKSLKYHTRAWWSNWGTRVNAYAWGYDVVTAGYGDHPASDPNDQNKWYTSYFNGTSSATALVGGAVALVQSYTKEFYKNIVPHKEVYLDAAQMRTLIDLSGTFGDPNYNIGKKPDVGAMMALVADGTVLPNVAPDTPALWAKPHSVSGIRYDMDKDGRADLISYSGNSWKVDLSTVAPNISNPDPDNYGEWDLMINLPMSELQKPIYYPVVHDYDSDGDADLAVYDSKNGVWYIKYTMASLLEQAGQEVTVNGEWDLIIDYSSDPSWKPYGRPMPADYNDDNWLDTAIVTPDGHWVIDFGGIGRIEKQGSNIVYVSDFGEFEKDVKFLTDAQLAEAPGWAYLPIGVDYTNSRSLVYKIPDGLNGEGFVRVIPQNVINGEINYDDSWIISQTIECNTNSLGGNVSYSIGSSFEDVMDHENIVTLNDNGIWEVLDGDDDGWLAYTELTNPSWPDATHGSCYPVPADYDGDGRDDLVLKCPDSWKIAFYDNGGVNPQTGNSYMHLLSERIIELSDSTKSLPPTVYPGGVNYQDVKGTLEYYNLWNVYQDKDPFTPHTVQCLKHWAVQPQNCFANVEQ